MKKALALFAFLLLISCAKEDETIDFIVMNVNDIYEIDAIGDGSIGGLARVASLYEELKKENKNTLLVHGGDFFSPSLLGTLKDGNGDRFYGKQMIETMNAVGFDLVAFGNHEFDLKQKDFQKRLNESTFQWIGTNIQLNSNGKLEPFYVEKNNVKTPIPRTVTFDFTEDDGSEISVGFFSSTTVSYTHLTLPTICSV